MKSHFSFRQALATLAVALFAAGAAPAAQAMATPSALAPASDESLYLKAGARGVQIYECRAKGDSHAWTLVAPEADLFAIDGRRIGAHGAGPHWRFADGGHIGGRVKARAEAQQPGDIPWLLLEAHPLLPRERLSAVDGVTSIQRINTLGGQAPADGCGAATAGTVVRVPYTADYLFYRR